MSDSFTGNPYFNVSDVDLELYQDDPFQYEQYKYMKDLGEIDVDIMPLEVRIYLDWLQEAWKAVASIPEEVESMDLFELQLDIKSRQVR